MPYVSLRSVSLRNLRLAALGAAAVMLAAPGVAIAQDNPQGSQASQNRPYDGQKACENPEDEMITITGSRIKRKRGDARPYPTRIVDGSDFALVGASSTGDALARAPSYSGAYYDRHMRGKDGEGESCPE